MQCKRCGSEIPGGEVFCPRCGEEVQLVPDYNSVEYMIQQKKAEEDVRLREEQERMRKRARQEKKAAELKKKKRKKILWISVLLVLFMVAVAIFAVYFIRYSREHSYDYQYQMAYEAYDAKDYAAAEGYAKRALELHPGSDNALRLLAETYLHEGDTDAGIAVLMQYIEKYPDSIDAYARIISVYEEEQRPDEVRALMEACNNDVILSEFSSYIPSEVQLVTEPGEYTSKISVELACGSGTVYYTTDGTMPDVHSQVYSEPIMLEEGTTKIQAICYSPAGIPGDMISGEYTVTLAIPNPPFISPVSGDYEEGTEITVVVPDGCEAYYAFDSVADSSDNLYTGPVEMPEGEHIFSVIVVDENGKQSYPASETYVVG